MNCIYFTKLEPHRLHGEADFHTLLGNGACKVVCYRRPEDRQRSLMGKLLLLYALRQNGWQRNVLPAISYTSYGRPYLDGFAVDFNISHSGHLVALSYTDSGRTGIDVEQLQPIDFSEYNVVFSRGEQEAIRSGGNPLVDFYKCWTAKESVMKAAGGGFSIDPLQVVIRGGRSVLGDSNWYLFHIRLSYDYMACIASDQSGPLKIRYVAPEVLELL